MDDLIQQISDFREYFDSSEYEELSATEKKRKQSEYQKLVKAYNQENSRR